MCLESSCSSSFPSSLVQLHLFFSFFVFVSPILLWNGKSSFHVTLTISFIYAHDVLPIVPCIFPKNWLHSFTRTLEIPLSRAAESPFSLMVNMCCPFLSPPATLSNGGYVWTFLADFLQFSQIHRCL